ncbi:MAG: flagellar motor switch protein FliN [Puniceicoccaceae bacterium]|nr:MAG: flagellar motor switch protein FliN [Puniceicoccaceae bacterium]
MIVDTETKDLGLLLDVKVRLTVQLGSCHLPMKEILELSSGSVIQLNQEAKDPVGLYVNDKLIAYGEVVVVEDHFGIKITELAGKQK